MSFRSILRDRIVTPVRRLLAQGLSPETLALTVAVGVCCAAFPVIGLTTVLCTIAALALRLNMPIIQAINYLGAPLQIAALLPLFKAGEWIFRAPPMKMSVREIVAFASSQPTKAIAFLWVSTWHAVVAWLLIAPLVGAAIYYALRPALRASAARLARHRAASLENASRA